MADAKGRVEPAKKTKKREKGKGDSVQAELPIADVEGSFAVMKDGSYVGYLELPGVNHSLFNDQQKADEAFAMADIIASIPVPFSILKYPVPSPSAQQLTLIDKAIARERDAMFSASTERERAAAEQKISILETHMRPEAKREATSGSRVVWPNWFAFSFERKVPRAEAARVMGTVAKMAEERLGSRPRFAEEEDVRRLCELYLTPSAVSGSSLGYTLSMPMPATPAAAD